MKRVSSVVVALTTAGRRQIRQVSYGSAYLSNQNLMQHFGLGGAGSADQVEVRWPSGAVTTLEHLPADRLLLVTEGEPNVKAWER